MFSNMVVILQWLDVYSKHPHENKTVIRRRLDAYLEQQAV